MLPTRNIVSFSLYGDKPLCTVGAVRNAELIHSIYPGWVARFYVADSVAEEVIAALRERGAEVVAADPRFDPMMVRALVAADQTVGRFAIRDADSRLNVREKAAVDEWLASGRTFHIMRDSIHHRPRMLGGMWGGVGGAIPDIGRLMLDWSTPERLGKNDEFCGEVLYPRIAGDYLCHDSWGRYFDDGKPFPPHPPLHGTSFVGEIVTAEFETLDPWRRLGEMDNEVWVRELELRQVRGERDGQAAEAKAIAGRAAETESRLQAELADKLRRIAELQEEIAASRHRQAKRDAQHHVLKAEIKKLRSRLEIENAPPDLRRRPWVARFIWPLRRSVLRTRGKNRPSPAARRRSLRGPTTNRPA